jgi:predicted membrane-bound mannosyltransferase/DNA-binding beta-propeller fold protein YncE
MTTTAERLRSYWGERQFDRTRLVALAVQYWEIALFATLIGVALGLRFWGLGARAIHHDESLHMLYAWDLAQGKGYEHVPFMHGPFQFFGSAAMFKIFGDSDFTARLLYASFGSALVGLPYFLRGFIGRTGAIIAAVLLAVSPSLLYFSRFARGDIYMAFWTLAMVIVVWRYLKEQKPIYLYGVPLFLMLGFVTKEVTFMTTTIFLAYLEYLLANDMVDQVRASRTLRPWQIVSAYAVLVPTAWLIAAFWPLLEGPRKRWSLQTLPPAGHVVIIMGTFALPLFAPGVQKIPFLSLGDVDKYDEPSGPEPLMQLSVLFFILASAYIGLLWNWRVWGIGALIFYVPFFLLYTTFFTNGGDIWAPGGDFWHGEGGWWTGMWGSLDYWLGQQLVRRGGQPDYYYLMTVPIYDFLPLVFATGGALFYAFRGRLEQKLLTLAAVLLIFVFSVIPKDSASFIGQYHVHAGFIIAIAAVLLLSMDTFTKFLVFWSLSMLFAISVAGEKMPWLTIHIALPLSILAARVLSDIFSTLGHEFRKRATEAQDAGAQRKQKKEPEEEAAPALTPERLLPLLYGGALAFAAALIFQAAGPASGLGVVAWLLSAGALGAVLWTANQASWKAAGQVAAVALFAALFVFTVRAAIMAAYDEGDPDGYPQEMLIYAQGSPKLDVILNQIERVAEASGQGKDLNVIVDNSSNVWPWPWYLRDQHHELSNFDPDFAPAPGSVVLVSVKNQDKMQPFLDQYEDPIPYTHMWWFPEFYKGLSAGDFLGDVFRGRLLSTWRAYYIDRTVRGGAATPDMLAFFPKEFGSVIDVTPVPGIAGPSHTLPEESVTVIGQPGSGPGAFAQPADLAVDADGNIYVADTLNHRFQKISPDGLPVTIGEEGTGEGQFGNPRQQSEDFPEDGPWGVGIDPLGNVYVADTWNHRLQKFGPDLAFVQEWGAGEFFGPRDIAVDAVGDVYVVDTGNKRVLKYQNNGQLIAVFGRPGNGPAEFSEPTSISIAPNGDIYVADFWNQRIQHFNPEFEYIDEIAVPSWGSQGITDRGYIVALEGGRVLATDPANGRIIAFGPDGEKVASWALPSTIGTTRPVGITVDEQGQAYISDAAASHIVRVSVLVLFSQPPEEP